MTLASRVLDRFRSRLVKLVEKERQACGCAKSAMSRIARKIQMSQASLYRVVNRYGDVQVKAHQYMALLVVVFGSKARRSKFCTSAKSSEARLSA